MTKELLLSKLYLRYENGVSTFLILSRNIFPCKSINNMFNLTENEFVMFEHQRKYEGNFFISDKINKPGEVFVWSVIVGDNINTGFYEGSDKNYYTIFVYDDSIDEVFKTFRENYNGNLEISSIQKNNHKFYMADDVFNEE